MLQEKTCHESTIADLQKEVQVLTEDKDQILVKLPVGHFFCLTLD